MSERQPSLSLSDISSFEKESTEKMSLETTKTEKQAYVEQPQADQSVQGKGADGPNMQVLTILVILTLVGIVVIKPLREFTLWFIQNVFLPTLVWCCQTGSLWLVWLAKGVINSHADFFKHLITPRSIVFPTLEDQREESDKKINRKVE